VGLDQFCHHRLGEGLALSDQFAILGEIGLKGLPFRAQGGVKKMRIGKDGKANACLCARHHAAKHHHTRH